jgi:hypothetical protein
MHARIDDVDGSVLRDVDPARGAEIGPDLDLAGLQVDSLDLGISGVRDEEPAVGDGAATATGPMSPSA